MVRRHRIEGLASHALTAAGIGLPQQLAEELSTDAAAIARQNLGFAAESVRLARKFEAAGLRFLFVKGATLDVLAYGTLGLKRARDIDLAIDPGAIEQACALVIEAGYERVEPGPEIGPEQFPIWLRLCKETSWRHPRTGILVELHNGLVDNPDLLRGIDVHAPRQLVEIGPGLGLPTLADEPLYAYLCVHGATHAWSRLKWLADLGAYLSPRTPEEIERLHRAAVHLGAGRASGQALLLCADLLEISLSTTLRAELRADRATLLLVRAAKRVLSGETELDDTIFGTLPIHLSHFLLGPGFGHKIGEVGRKLRNHHDQAGVALPRPLRFLYPLISLPSWIWRRIRGPAPL